MDGATTYENLALRQRKHGPKGKMTGGRSSRIVIIRLTKMSLLFLLVNVGRRLWTIEASNQFVVVLFFSLKKVQTSKTFAMIAPGNVDEIVSALRKAYHHPARESLFLLEEVDWRKYFVHLYNIARAR